MSVKNEKKYKVLLVEDDILLAKAYLFFLQRAGFVVTHIDNGTMVLATIKKEKPDLVLLDLIIPGKNGFEVLEELKRSPQSRVPVIVVSNLGQESDERLCRSLGAVDYVIKSNVKVEDVIKKIYEHLS